MYTMTRVTWDEMKRKNVDNGNEKIVRGYVVDPRRNDVTVFQVDVSELAPITTAQFLWDYVSSCGISKEWKKI